jgi:membrane protease YdiL (CAAX protease family)
MPEEQSIRSTHEAGGFQPTWGPVMALVWATAISVSMIVVVFVAQRRGLISVTLPNGKFDPHFVMWITTPPQIACIAIVASRLRANPLDALALRFPRRVVRSVLIGFALVAVSIAADFAFELLQYALASPNGNVPMDQSQELLAHAASRSGLLPNLALFGFIVPIEEEMMFRGLLLLSFFHTRLWFWGAAAITSALFAIGHNTASLDVLVHAPYFVMGIVFAAALRLTGSLWVPIGMHASLNCIAILGPALP